MYLPQDYWEVMPAAAVQLFVQAAVVEAVIEADDCPRPQHGFAAGKVVVSNRIPRLWLVTKRLSCFCVGARPRPSFGCCA